MTSRKLRQKIYLVAYYSNEITSRKLLSNCHVLRIFYFNLRVVKLNLRKSARLLVKEVLVFWEKSRIPTKTDQRSNSKVES